MASTNKDVEATSAVAEPSTSQIPGTEEKLTPAEKSEKEMNQLEIQGEAVEFVGLGKEELLVLANRPFWVRLRWALFFSFWVLWLGLLVGAALIIGLSPGCENYPAEDEMTTIASSTTT